MLGHPHRHRRQVEHLPPLHTHLGRGRQISTASGALAGLMPQPLVRIGHQRQCRPRMPRLPARLAAALATQRLRRGLGERRIRRRRLRRVLRILPQLPPQLGDLGLELRDPLGLNSDESGKLLVRGARIISHHFMIRGQPRTSTRHACQTTTNTKVTSVTRDAWHLTSYVVRRQLFSRRLPDRPDSPYQVGLPNSVYHNGNCRAWRPYGIAYANHLGTISTYTGTSTRTLRSVCPRSRLEPFNICNHRNAQLGLVMR